MVGWRFSPNRAAAPERWEHDEMAGSLLRGGAAGRPLRGAPSASVQQRYRSSSEHQPAQRGVGGLSYQMKNASVMVSTSAEGVIFLPCGCCIEGALDMRGVTSAVLIGTF